MKRWIHAATQEDIEYKTRDYIAAWAKDDVKEGNKAASYEDFKAELEKEGLKANRDRYDYYVACYSEAALGKKN